LHFCVNYVNQIGALWIGEWKRHFVPFKEQASYGKGKRFILPYMDENKSVSCSSKTNQFLKNEELTKKGEEELLYLILLK
jgi:hypothetical protein